MQASRHGTSPCIVLAVRKVNRLQERRLRDHFDEILECLPVVNWVENLFTDTVYGYMLQCSEKMKRYFDLAFFQFDGKSLKVGECFQGIQDSSMSPFAVFLSGYPSVGDHAIMNETRKHSCS